MDNISLQSWIEKLLLCSNEELCEKYKFEEDADEELGSPHLNAKRVMKSPIDESLLLQLHEKLRDLSCEDAIWNGVVWYLSQPLPLNIAHDFIDRKVVAMLANSRQHDEILWRLVRKTGDPDPLLTMAKARYEKDDWSLRDWEEILVEIVKYDADDSYCLEIVTGWFASCVEKEDAFYKVVEQHPRRQAIIDYRNSQRESQKVFHEFYVQLQEAEASDVDIKSLEKLYNAEYADYLLHLAQHEDSSPLLLQKLAQFKKSKYAAKIRAAAKGELYRRQKLK